MSESKAGNDFTRPLTPAKADAARKQFEESLKKIVKTKPKPAAKK